MIQSLLDKKSVLLVLFAGFLIYRGKFEDFKGDSSEIVVDEALKFITAKVKKDQSFFTVLWYGTPHSPWVAAEVDKKPGTR